ncbi:hypothetical protein HK405_013065, partial [Cladochytrium tenue]
RFQPSTIAQRATAFGEILTFVSLHPQLHGSAPLLRFLGVRTRPASSPPAAPGPDSAAAAAATSATAPATILRQPGQTPTPTPTPPPLLRQTEPLASVLGVAAPASGYVSFGGGGAAVAPPPAPLHPLHPLARAEALFGAHRTSSASSSAAAAATPSPALRARALLLGSASGAPASTASLAGPAAAGADGASTAAGAAGAALVVSVEPPVRLARGGVLLYERRGGGGGGGGLQQDAGMAAGEAPAGASVPAATVAVAAQGGQAVT